MAVADLDQNLPSYLYRNQMSADGSLAQRYVGGMGGSGITPLPSPVFNPIPGQPINYQMPKFNLGSLFNGGNRAGQTAPMVQTTKSQAVQKPLNTAFTVRTNNAGAEQQSLKDYAAQVLGGQPQAQAAADSEINSINQIYGTGGDSIEARLALLNRQEQAANNIAAQRAAGQVRRGINAQRAGGGSSSYLDRLLSQQLYATGAQNAGRGAQQGRNDLQWLTGQRTGQVGRRQSILDTLAQRGLNPALAGQQLETGGLMNLNRLAELDYDNNIYQTPEDVMRQRMEFANYLSPYLQY